MALLRGDRHLEAPILVNWRACVTTRCPVRLGDGNPRAPPESGSNYGTAAAVPMACDEAMCSVISVSTRSAANLPFPGNKLESAGQPSSHPNSRFCAPITQCPIIADEYFEPVGWRSQRSCSAGGARPPSRSSPSPGTGSSGIHGGATLCSETAAAATGALVISVLAAPFAVLLSGGLGEAVGLGFILAVGLLMVLDDPPRRRLEDLEGAAELAGHR